MTIESPPTPAAQRWPLPQRVGFRFAFVYLALYFFPLPSGLCDPYFVADLFDPLWAWLVPRFAATALHLTLPPTNTGGGDTTFDHVRILCMFLLAVLAAAIWSVVDRKRLSYRTLYAWARVWLRYVLAFTMIDYGMMKIIQMQFPSPTYPKLMETYGDSTPWRLLWNFMGYSRAYSFFGGAGECLAGVLLLFRRTTTLGALVAAGVLSNVVMINFGYDVGVKLGSMHLLALALFLAAPDLPRLAGLFVLNRPAALADLGPHLERRWMRIGGVVLKIAVICFVEGLELHDTRLQIQHRDAKHARPEGWYAVSSFVEDGKEVPEASCVDGVEPAKGQHVPGRWSALVLNRDDLALRWPGPVTRRYAIDGDVTKGPIQLVPLAKNEDEPPKGTPPAGELRVTFGPGASALAEGTLDGHALQVKLSRQRTADLPLMKVGFRWIKDDD